MEAESDDEILDIDIPDEEEVSKTPTRSLFDTCLKLHKLEGNNIVFVVFRMRRRLLSADAKNAKNFSRNSSTNRRAPKSNRK